MSNRTRLNDIDNWISNFQPKSKILIERWNGTAIINNIFEQESRHRFRSAGDRLNYRLDLWSEFSRVQTNSVLSRDNHGNLFSRVKRHDSELTNGNCNVRRYQTKLTRQRAATCSKYLNMSTSSTFCNEVQSPGKKVKIGKENVHVCGKRLPTSKSRSADNIHKIIPLDNGSKYCSRDMLGDNDCKNEIRPKCQSFSKRIIGVFSFGKKVNPSTESTPRKTKIPKVKEKKERNDTNEFAYRSTGNNGNANIFINAPSINGDDGKDFADNSLVSMDTTTKQSLKFNDNDMKLFDRIYLM